MEGIKKYEHNPAHLYYKGGNYFITGATYKHHKYFADNQAKQKLLQCIQKGFKDKDWILEDYVILDNHYHLMVNSRDNYKYLKDIINGIHKFSAIWLNKRDNCRGRRVWYNYWDKLITFETSYYARLNYLWYNPVKHGYCEYAEDYEFGSFKGRYEEDKIYIENLKAKYPWDKIDLKIDK